MLELLKGDVIERQDVTIHAPQARARRTRAGLVIPSLVQTMAYTAKGRELRSIRGGAVTAFWFGQAIMQAFGSGSAGNAPNIDFLSDTIKCMLTTSSYAVNQDTHVFKSDVTNEVSGTGYTAAGTTITTPTLGYTGGTNVIKFDGDDAQWTSSTITARLAVIYDSTPSTDATRPLLSYIDFGADVSTTNGTFAIVFAAAGILTITPS